MTNPLIALVGVGILGIICASCKKEVQIRVQVIVHRIWEYFWPTDPSSHHQDNTHSSDVENQITIDTITGDISLNGITFAYHQSTRNFAITSRLPPAPRAGAQVKKDEAEKPASGASSDTEDGDHFDPDLRLSVPVLNEILRPPPVLRDVSIREYFDTSEGLVDNKVATLNRTNSLN